MQITKRQFAHDVLHIIYELCRLIYNLKSSDDVENVFSAPRQQVETIISKIVNALPDDLFSQSNAHRIKDLEQILAKEFIFFQVQEKVDDSQYQTDLANFIMLFSRDIHNKLQLSTEGG